MKRTITLAVLALGAGVASGAASAQTGVAISGALGTPGVTGEVQVSLSKVFQLRGDYNYLKYSHGATYDSIHYDGDLKLSTFGAFLDVHPFSNSFLFSGGAYFGDKNVGLGAAPTGNVTINGTSYTPAQVGRLDGKAKLEDTAPFLGLGWDTTFQGDEPWGFKFIVGAMYTGRPDVTLVSSGGSLSNDPTFKSQVAAEQTKVSHDIDNYKYYPVVQAGVTFHF